MAVETPVEVLAVEADSVLLRARGGCRGCTGCAGRCGLGWHASQPIRLPRDRFGFPLDSGMALVLRCEAVELRDRALVGYGIPLGGLVVGSMLGAAIAQPMGWQADASVAMAALAGTLLGLAVSKQMMRPMPSLRLLEVRREAGDPSQQTGSHPTKT